MRIEPLFVRQLKPPLREGVLTILLPDAQEVSLEVCAAFAKREGACVVTSPYIQNGALLAACVEPGTITVQCACFPDAGLIPGVDVTVFDTQLGKLALACGADIFQPQYARLAALKGCQLLIALTSMPLSRELLLAGPWSAAQANCLPVAVASDTEGQLVLPCTMTADSSGLRRSWFDTDELLRAYEAFPVFDGLNARFLKDSEGELT